MAHEPVGPAMTKGVTTFARKLRLLSAVGIAGVAAGVLGEVLIGGVGPRVPAAMSDGQIMTLPVIWVPLATLLAVAAWTYLLVGALHAPLLVRLLVGTGWLVLMWPFLQIGPLWVAAGYAGPVLLLAWRGWARPHVDFGLGESLIFGGLAFAAFFSAAVVSLMDAALPLLAYNVALSAQFVVFAAVALPLLILSGTDLAEIAGKAGSWATTLVQNWAPRRLAWLLLAFSLAQSGYMFTGGVRVTPGFWLTLVWVAGLLYAGRWLPGGGLLAQPPFPLLVSMLTLTLVAPIGGTLLATALPEGAPEWTSGVGFIGSAALAVLAALLLRRWLDRRWPGAWVALLVGALWMAWVMTGSQQPEWGPVSRGIDLGLAAVAAILAVAALAGRNVPPYLLVLGLEALVVFAVINAIQAGYRNDLDPGDLFAAIQAVLMIGYVIWLGLNRLRRVWAFGAGIAALAAAGLVVLNAHWLEGWQEYMQLGLMATALIWGIAVAHRRMGELLGEGATQIYQTFLLIGFTLMVVVVLGWNRALTPAPETLTDFGPLASFGLIAVGVPLYLLSVVQRAHRAKS